MPTRDQPWASLKGHSLFCLRTFRLGRLGPCGQDLPHGGSIAILRPRIVSLSFNLFWAILMAGHPIGQTPAAILHAHPRSARPVEPGRRRIASLQPRWQVLDALYSLLEGCRNGVKQTRIVIEPRKHLCRHMLCPPCSYISQYPSDGWHITCLLRMLAQWSSSGSATKELHCDKHEK